MVPLLFLLADHGCLPDSLGAHSGGRSGDGAGMGSEAEAESGERAVVGSDTVSGLGDAEEPRGERPRLLL